MLASRALVTFSCYVASALARTFSQSDSYSGANFLSGFQHEAINDPTHGRVTYVDQATALAHNLTQAWADHFIIRADHTTVLSPSGPGRESVRLQSYKKYTTHVAVWNIRHMPEGCSTWPAVWEVGDNWPHQGEIDIVEGVNDQSPNQASFHTGPDCTMPETRAQTGTETGGNNCDSAATGNTGCGVKSAQTNSYGPAFNRAGGGFYAIERTNEAVKIWFWSRRDRHIPGEVLLGLPSINTDHWGAPFAYYPSTSCDFTTHLGDHNLIINLTLCGDWAGNADLYTAAGCPADCISFVNNDPSAFAEAYFDVQWLKIYE